MIDPDDEQTMSMGMTMIADRLRALCHRPFERPWITFFAFAGFAMVWFDDIYSGMYWQDPVYALYCAAHIAVFLTYVLFPEAGTVVGSLMWAVYVLLVPSVSLAPFVFTVLMMAGCMFLSPLLGCISGVIAVAAQSVNVCRHGYGVLSGVGGVLTCDAVVIAGLLCGIALREHERRMRMAAMVRYQRREHAAVRQLHDYIANDLSAIVAIAESLGRDDAGSPSGIPNAVNDARDEAATNMTDDDMRGQITELNDIGRDALRRLHKVITLLREDDGESHVESGIERSAIVGDGDRDVATLIERQRALLASLGLNGVVFVADDLALYVDADTNVLLGDLLREVFGNMLKYADPERGYTLSLLLEGEGLRLRVSDVPADNGASGESRKSRDEARTGGGLDDYRKRVAAIGGRWESRLSDDEWSLDVLIPVGA